MAKIRLLQAVCTLAMLAATPALAQRPEAGMTNTNGQANPAAAHPAQGTMAPANDGANSTGMVDANPRGTASGTGSQNAHRMVMAHSTSTMHDQSADSQDAAVNRLNDQSYQAAQKGEPFMVSGNDTSSRTMTAPTTMQKMSGSSAGGSSSKQ